MVPPDLNGNEPRVVLSARGLRRDFAGFVAVRNVDLDVRHRNIHALIVPPSALGRKVLLLAEPMAGMGHEDVATVSALIRSVASDRAVLMVEHNLTVVADLCDWITVMQRGEVLAAGDYAAVSRDERVK